MSLAKKWTLILNIIMLLFTGMWWWRDKDFEPMVAVIGFLGSIILSLFLSDENEVKPNPSSINFALNDRYPDLIDEFNASISVKMVGTNYQSFITRYYNSFSNLLKRGGIVRLVGCEPTETIIESLTFRSQSSLDKNVTKSKIQNYIKTLQTFSKSYDTQIQLRLLPYISSYGMIKLDKIDGASRIYVKLYTFKGDGRTPVFTFDKEKDREWFDFFSLQFDKLWNSTPNERFELQRYL